MRTRRQRLTTNYVTTRALRAYLRTASVVAEVTGVPLADVTRPNKHGRPDRRRDPAVLARQAALYLTVVAADIRMASLARALDRPRCKILKACRMTEDARDDHEFDALLDRMEAML